MGFWAPFSLSGRIGFQIDLHKIFQLRKTWSPRQWEGNRKFAKIIHEIQKFLGRKFIMNFPENIRKFKVKCSCFLTWHLIFDLWNQFYLRLRWKRAFYQKKWLILNYLHLPKLKMTLRNLLDEGGESRNPVNSAKKLYIQKIS